MDHLPPVPEHFLVQALEVAKNYDQHFEQMLNLSNQQNLMHLNPLVPKTYTDSNGQTVFARMNPRYKIGNEWEQWVKQYISNRFSDTGISTSVRPKDSTYQTSQSTLVHVDGVRKFALLYVIQQSNTDQWTRWFQEQNQPVVRAMSSSYRSLNENKLTEIDQVCMPLKTWVYIDVRVLHQVTNTIGERIALHVSFQEDVFNKFETENNYEEYN